MSLAGTGLAPENELLVQPNGAACGSAPMASWVPADVEMDSLCLSLSFRLRSAQAASVITRAQEIYDWSERNDAKRIPGIPWTSLAHRCEKNKTGRRGEPEQHGPCSTAWDRVRAERRAHRVRCRVLMSVVH